MNTLKRFVPVLALAAGTFGNLQPLAAQDTPPAAARPGAPAAPAAPLPVPPRTASGRPDLSGNWQIDFPYSVAGREAMRPLDGRPVPRQPWVTALNVPAMASNRPGQDPWPPNNQRCLVAGTVRAMKGNFPWRLIQQDKQVVILWEEDGRFAVWPVFASAAEATVDPKAPPAWDGHSQAWWDGDTLVVRTTGHNGKTPLPHGLLHTMLLKITHHFTLINDGQKLEDRILIEDPGAFTRPFEIKSVFSRQPPEYKLRDYRCAENNKDLPAPIPWWAADWGPD